MASFIHAIYLLILHFQAIAIIVAHRLISCESMSRKRSKTQPRSMRGVGSAAMTAIGTTAAGAAVVTVMLLVPRQQPSRFTLQQWARHTQLDVNGHVWQIDEFLSPSEVEHLRSIGESSPTLMKNSVYKSVEFRRPWEQSSDKVANLIEYRIGNLTGIAPNANDSPMKLAVSRAWHQPDDGMTNQLQNLHHDKHQRPGRVVTVLIYLSDETTDGLLGGDTLFPCVRAAHSSTSQLCTRLESAFATGDLFLSPPTGIYDTIACFDTAAAEAASEMCRPQMSDDVEVTSTAATEASVLRVTPMRGRALVFLQEAPELGGDTLTRMWHGGCRVARGEKWTMQHFKELPG